MYFINKLSHKYGIKCEYLPFFIYASSYPPLDVTKCYSFICPVVMSSPGATEQRHDCTKRDFIHSLSLLFSTEERQGSVQSLWLTYGNWVIYLREGDERETPKTSMLSFEPFLSSPSVFLLRFFIYFMLSSL